MALAALAACTGGERHRTLLVPPTTAPTASTTTTTLPDFSTVELSGVAGRTTTTRISITPGRAGLSGTVTGPEGPVAGATVRAERLVGEAAAALDVATGPDGRWAIAGIKGGGYRVRAWRAPDLALVQPALFFLGAGESKAVDLKVERYGAAVVTFSISPSPPPVNQPAKLVVQVTAGTVDDRGVVRATPLAGAQVELAPAGAWQVLSPAVTVVDGAGLARWLLRCLLPGPQPVTVVVRSSERTVLDLPHCAEPATTTTPPPPPPTTAPPTTASTTTTTTRRSSTTTTTKKPR